MKLLITLTLMALSSIAIADVTPTFTNKTDLIYVSKKTHDELNKQYNTMIDDVNSQITIYGVMSKDYIKLVSASVIYKNEECVRESIEEKEWCELKRNQLIDVLTSSVMESNSYKSKVELLREKMKNPDLIVNEIYEEQIDYYTNRLETNGLTKEEWYEFENLLEIYWKRNESAISSKKPITFLESAMFNVNNEESGINNTIKDLFLKNPIIFLIIFLIILIVTQCIVHLIFRIRYSTLKGRN